MTVAPTLAPTDDPRHLSACHFASEVVLSRMVAE
jgi:hypothetical protein